MDILKKFRYNFHYWLRNCYQAEEIKELQDQEINKVHSIREEVPPLPIFHKAVSEPIKPQISHSHQFGAKTEVLNSKDTKDPSSTKANS